LEMTDATSRKLSIRTCIHFCTNDDVTDDAFSAFVPLGQRQHVGRLVVGSFGNGWPSIDERLRLCGVCGPHHIVTGSIAQRPTMSQPSSSVHVKIFSDFDGGNIEYVRQEPNRNDARVVDVILNIRPDVYTELEEIHHMQYFCFASTVTGISDESGEDEGVTVRYVIDNASKASYPEAWPGTTVCYTTTNDPHTDVDSWRRNAETYYTQSQLHWEHLHATNGETTHFSYFPIYSRRRHDQLLSRCRTSPACQEVLTLGQSIQGRDIDCVVAGTGSTVAWIIHQQHPGTYQSTAHIFL
jgi:Cytosolic carboxypeptidase N-terminal domain